MIAFFVKWAIVALLAYSVWKNIRYARDPSADTHDLPGDYALAAVGGALLAVGIAILWRPMC